ncbi:MAG TPA: o-succinylbenzoate synthase [Bacteroidales bacterium]|nr:o-succinylbenzoate synthase [Bacteroidales bacterium]
MLKARYFKHTLKFKRPAGTSRGALLEKDTWFVIVEDTENPGRRGIGECSPLKGLSFDDHPDYEKRLAEVCENFHETKPGHLKDWPSIRFGVEMALKDLSVKGENIFFPSPFTRGEKSMKINGLIWMGDKLFMRQQIDKKLEDGFDCLKMKIGAINWPSELELLKNIRSQYSPETLELRVDANGAFSVKEAPEKLEALSKLKIHSIEQPIRQGQVKDMAALCSNTPVPIALDEELIGIHNCEEKTHLIDEISPQFIILKPSLVGGFESSEEWVDIAERFNAGWWVTSALESNIGLNAIAQWTYTLGNSMPQGLGTGQLYTNNISSPLDIASGQIWYRPEKKWEIDFLNI